MFPCPDFAVIGDGARARFRIREIEPRHMLPSVDHHMQFLSSKDMKKMVPAQPAQPV
jgi:hypothetical protein